MRWIQPHCATDSKLLLLRYSGQWSSKLRRLGLIIALEYSHHLWNNLTKRLILIPFLLISLSRLLKLLFSVRMLLPFLFEFLRDEILFSVKCWPLGSNLTVEHLHAVHLLVLCHQALRCPQLLLVCLVKRLKHLWSVLFLLLHFGNTTLFLLLKILL